MNENICNIKTCKNYVENTYKKCIQHRLLNRKSQQKRRGVETANKKHQQISTQSRIKSRTLKIRIQDKINKYYLTDKNKKYCLENFITVDYVKKLIDNTTNCIYCNDLIKYEYSKNDKKQFSVDRIDSKIAHIINNIQIICYSCNCSKQDKTHNEFIEYIKNKNSCI